MSVAHILDEKGRETVTITADHTMAQAVDTLSHHRIGALVVVGAGGEVEGIFSERDVVKALAERGVAALGDPISQRMTRSVATCASSAGIPEVMGMMTDGKFRHVPVVENGRLSGMVSIGDVVKYRLAEMEAEHKALRDYIATA